MPLKQHPTKPDTLVYRAHPAALAWGRASRGEPIITDERAGEIRGELCKQYPGTWLHEYHKAIEAEVLAYAPRYLELSTSVSDLLASCREGWRHADELEQERKRLADLNTFLLEALHRISLASQCINGSQRECGKIARSAIAMANPPAVQHTPSDDTEGGAL